jgi:hypothetical protein
MRFVDVAGVPNNRVKNLTSGGAKSESFLPSIRNAHAKRAPQREQLVCAYGLGSPHSVQMPCVLIGCMAVIVTYGLYQTRYFATQLSTASHHMRRCAVLQWGG